MLDQIISLYDQLQSIFANQIFQDYGILGLFINSLLSATALPIPAELLTSALISGGENKILIGIALLGGSVIGGTLNYLIGYGGGNLGRIISKLFHSKPKVEHEKKSHKILEKFGWRAVFFSPFIFVIGDLILISAGARKMNAKKYFVLMISGKALKATVTILGLSILI